MYPEALQAELWISRSDESTPMARITFKDIIDSRIGRTSPIALGEARWIMLSYLFFGGGAVHYCTLRIFACLNPVSFDENAATIHIEFRIDKAEPRCRFRFNANLRIFCNSTAIRLLSRTLSRAAPCTHRSHQLQVQGALAA
jgi:hypothetical protein